MIMKIEYLAKFGKQFLTGFPTRLWLDEKYNALRFSTREELLTHVKIFGDNHSTPYQYTFKIIEEITIENNV